ncbi:MAG: MobA/MobL family protein [Clostridiales bacterium]|nr:MobA/MobL family protein [Clostridiales bacterium]
MRNVNKKTVYATVWNDRGNAELCRTAWASAVNAELEREGSNERIDRRLYDRQGIERIPAIHLCVAAAQM